MNTTVEQTRMENAAASSVETSDEPARTVAIPDVKNKTSPKIALKAVFEQMDAAGVSYCLLREYEDPATAAEKCEIDLLVAPQHFLSMSKVLAANDFVSLPAWGHAPHRFFVAYDQSRGVWIKFDIVTDLRYGSPIRRFSIDLVESCLKKRSKQEMGYCLSPEHEFITLFLHCLLDKADFRSKHRERLSALYALATEDAAMNQRIGALVDTYIAPVLNWKKVADAIELDQWQSLLRKRQDVVRLFLRRNPLINIWRNVSARMLLGARPILFSLFRRGVTIALLAPDGAGKSTLAQSLTRDPYLRARLIYMGTNVHARGLFLPTTKWLHKKVKELEARRAKGAAKIAKGFAFINRVIEQWYRSLASRYFIMRGRFVVYDRYVYDSWLVARSSSVRKRVRRWLLESACPSPDIVVLLDAPGEMLFKRKGEHNIEWLEQQRQGYLKLLPRVPNMVVVDAEQSAEAVKREVIALIWQRYSRTGVKDR